MDLEEEYLGGHVILRLAGELDLQAADGFRQRAEAAMERHDCNRLIVNMKKVSFIDSSGLGAILGRYRRIALRQGRMIIVGPPSHVRAVLEVSGVTRIIPVVATESRALA